ncbi:hypothetical protein AB4028_01850 [Janibacter sp. RAF20_2_2]|uniref:hypothetical protein n=1 Tax=unclassified Janibacter TaxID=2649294 RepID=UPI003F8F1491
MGWTFDRFTGRVDGHDITVEARSGPIHGRFVLKIDGQPQDTRKAAVGTHVLEGLLPDGDPVRVRIVMKAAGLFGQEYFLEAKGTETKLGEGWLL